MDKYLKFIESCRSKNYSNLVTHKHHIIPRHIGGDDSLYNIIELSVDDHYIAHMLLAESYDDSDWRKQSNIASAIKLNNGFKTLEDIEKYSNSMKGSSNPNYGNKWSNIQRENLSKKIKEYWSDPNNLCKIQKPKSDTSKMGKHNKFGENNPFYNKNHSDETKNKLSDIRKGKKPSNIKPFRIGDNTYQSLYDGEKSTGIKATTIRWRILSKNEKYKDFEYI